MGRDAGLDEARLRALGAEDAASNAVFSSEERAVLRYADAMTDTPVVVTDELFEALRRHYDEVQLVELTSAFAWENYRARFDHALGVESEGFSEEACCPTPIGVSET